MSEKKKEAMTLADALVSIQGRLKAPKNKYNKFGSYYYRSCESILEAVKPLLVEYGVLMTIQDDLVCLGDRYYIKAIVTLQKGAESICNTGFAREDENKKGMDGSQITGTSSSYARKYALNGLLLIDDTKDADTDEFHKVTEQGTKKTVAQQPPTEQRAHQPAQPATTIFPDMVESELKAEQEALSCQSSIELTAVWNKYKTMNPAFAKAGSIFYKAVQSRGAELKKEGK
jgi:hypothetical protein